MGYQLPADSLFSREMPMGGVSIRREEACMATKKDVMELLAKGASWNETAQALGCSKATVSRCAEAMKERGIGAEELSRMTEAEVSALFADGRTKRGEEWLEPDYERICEQLANVPKMTLTLQWKRYCDCNPGRKRLYGLSRFCEKVGEYIRTHELSARIAHEPGRTLLVDWAGLTAEWTDPVTGRRQPAYLFVACLPYSGWIWARLFADMRSRSWIEAHVLCLEAMGGVPDILVPDNCATATDRKGKGAPIKLNDLYLEMAQHYGCGIVPARVRRPKDKALAEKAVDLCETWVLAPMSGEVFHSIAEANAEVERLVAQLDARPFQQRDGSRDDAFFGEERAALNPLPEARFEMYEWRRCKVSPDYHVQAACMRYSVPWRLVGHEVDVRIGSATVAVLEGGEVVAEHPRLSGRRGQYSTRPEDMPERHREASSLWTRGYFERRAAEVGPEARALISKVLDSHPVEPQGYVPCSNILSLAKGGRRDILEEACRMVNAAGAVPSYTRVRNAMSAIRAERAEGVGAPSAAAPCAQAPMKDRAAHAGRARGASHYRRGGSDAER